MKIKQINQGKNQTVINNESGVVNIGGLSHYVELQAKENMHVFREISSESQGKFVLAFILSIVVPVIGFIADLLTISPVFQLPFWIYIIVFFVVLFSVFMFYFDNYKIFGTEVPNYPAYTHLHNDRLVSRTTNGYVIFTYSSKCIYPNCHGEIQISEPPERYNGNYQFFAQCSLGGKQHSYGLDCNLVAYPIHVDWREEDPKETKGKNA